MLQHSVFQQQVVSTQAFPKGRCLGIRDARLALMMNALALRVERFLSRSSQRSMAFTILAQANAVSKVENSMLDRGASRPRGPILRRSVFRTGFAARLHPSKTEADSFVRARLAFRRDFERSWRTCCPEAMRAGRSICGSFTIHLARRCLPPARNGPLADSRSG